MQAFPYQWRAGAGYIPPPDQQPFPACPLPHAFPGFTYAAFPAFQGGAAHTFPTSFQASASAANPTPPPTPPSPIWPLNLAAYAMDPGAPPTHPTGPDPPAYAPAPPPPNPPGLELRNCNLRAGMHYLYAPKHTSLQVFRSIDQSWNNSNPNQAMPGLHSFGIFKVPCNFTVQELIQQLSGDENMAVTEVFETGGNSWSNGATVKHKDKSATKTLSSRGWTEKRGDSHTPVWLVLHQAE